MISKEKIRNSPRESKEGILYSVHTAHRDLLHETAPFSRHFVKTRLKEAARPPKGSYIGRKAFYSKIESDSSAEAEKEKKKTYFLSQKALEKQISPIEVISVDKVLSKIIEIKEHYLTAKCLIGDDAFELRKFDLAPLKHYNFQPGDTMEIKISTFKGERRYEYIKSRVPFPEEDEELDITGEIESLSFFQSEEIDDEDLIL